MFIRVFYFILALLYLASTKSVSPATLTQPVSLSRSSGHSTIPNVSASTASPSSYRVPPPKSLRMLPRMLPTAQSPQPSVGIWDDINSVKGNNNRNSSLPLQYHQPTYSRGNHGVDLNSYQSYQVSTNPFLSAALSPLHVLHQLFLRR